MVVRNSNQFAIERQSDLGLIDADATKLRQAVLNLLSNAAKFTHNGKVTLSFARQWDDGIENIVIKVADTGVGISEDNQKKLFANFQQANSSVAAQFGGTGLGLSLSQTLCKLMKGVITVTSAPGIGSTFTIILPAIHVGGNVMERVTERKPLAAKAPSIDMAAAAGEETNVLDDEGMSVEELALITPAPMAKPANSKKTIVIIDDDHSILELAERILSKEGFKTVLIDNAQLGLQIVRSTKPDYVILDIMLPGSDGWSLLNQIRRDGSCNDVKVLMLSVLDERQRALKDGADGFIAKPLDRDRLMLAIEHAGSSEMTQKLAV
jgi:CheY-like chemotaxis protein/anti-sigma regulatory factor (Ser/Thr protein kinase)